MAGRTTTTSFAAVSVVDHGRPIDAGERVLKVQLWSAADETRNGVHAGRILQIRASPRKRAPRVSRQKNKNRRRFKIDTNADTGRVGPRSRTRKFVELKVGSVNSATPVIGHFKPREPLSRNTDDDFTSWNRRPETLLLCGEARSKERDLTELSEGVSGTSVHGAGEAYRGTAQNERCARGVVRINASSNDRRREEEAGTCGAHRRGNASRRGSAAAAIQRRDRSAPGGAATRRSLALQRCFTEVSGRTCRSPPLPAGSIPIYVFCFLFCGSTSMFWNERALLQVINLVFLEGSNQFVVCAACHETPTT